MRKVCGIGFLVLAGIFFSAVCQFGSIGLGKATSFIVLGVIMVPGLVCLLIGVAFMGFRRWKRDTGIMLMSVAGVTALSLLTMACMLMDDTIRAIFEAQGVPVFDPSYASSGAILAVFAALGWWLCRSAPVIIAAPDTQ